MAYKFQLGAATVSGSLTRDAGDVTIRAHDNSVKITLDTAGAIDAAGSVTAGTSFIIGSADLNEVDMEKLDEITNGTATANKALVVDGSKNIAGVGTVGCGAVTSTGLGTFVGVAAGGAITTATTIAASGLASIGSLAIDAGSTIGIDTITDLITLNADGDFIYKDGAYDFDIASHDGTNGLKLDGTLVTATAAELNYTDVTSIGTAQASKAVVLDGSKDITGLNNVSAAQYTGNLVNSLDVAANGGLGMTPFNNSAAVSDLKMSGSFMPSTGVVVASENFVGLSASGSVKQFSIADLVAGIAGSGLTSTAGVLSTEAGATTGSVPDGAVLSEGYNFITGTTGGSYTLPNGPSAGDRVVFKNSSAGTATIDGFDDNQIDGVDSIILESPYAAVTLVYSKTSGSWAIV